jgi:hypothetical protein
MVMHSHVFIHLIFHLARVIEDGVEKACSFKKAINLNFCHCSMKRCLKIIIKSYFVINQTLVDDVDYNNM